jgi:hypothetical protein
MDIEMLLLATPRLALHGLSRLEVLGLKAAFRHAQGTPLPAVRFVLEGCGVMDGEGRIVSDELLGDFLVLSESDREQADALVESLPESDPLRRFHDVVLADRGENSRVLLECIVRRLGGSETGTPPHGFEGELLAAFGRQGDFSEGELAAPTLSSKPPRIMWTFKRDISTGFERFFTPEEARHGETYRLVKEGRFGELAAIHGPRSIPAFKAWSHMSHFNAPPLVKSHVFLHLGKRSLRFCFYASARKPHDPNAKPSELLERITKVLEESSANTGKLVISGPPTHTNISVSKPPIPRNSSKDFSRYIEYTINAWLECREILRTLKS